MADDALRIHDRVTIDGRSATVMQVREGHWFRVRFDDGTERELTWMARLWTRRD